MPTILAPIHAPLRLPAARGGWQQVCAAERIRSRSPSGPFKGRAAERHLLSWAKGIQSAPELHGHCQALVEDGSGNPGIARLSNCGTYASTNNVQFNISKLLETCGLPQMVTSVEGDGCITHTIKPSTVFSLVHKLNPASFKRQFGCDRIKLRKFWTSFLGT